MPDSREGTIFVVATHTISNAQKFWTTVLGSDLPRGLKLHRTYRNSEGTKASCLWEATTIKRVKELVESAVGGAGSGHYVEVV